MNVSVVIGFTVAGCALSVICALVLWSHRTIERIARNGYRTARQTLKELNGDK